MLRTRLACLVLCTIVISAYAKGAEPASFASYVRAARSGKVLARPTQEGYYYEKAENKHVCVQEMRHRDCRYFGCQTWVLQPDACPATGGTCTNCRTGDFFTSDFTCCKEEYGYDYSSKNLFQQKSAIGSCDWSIQWFRQDSTAAGVNGETCGWVNVINNVAWKVGTATGTCYMNDDSEHCGEPLCEQMVLSVQGDVYRSLAYSHEPPTTVTADANCINWANIGEEHCLEKKRGPVPNQADAKIQYNEYEQHPQTIYSGNAFIISGTITAVAGQKADEKYVDGLFEYVPYFTGEVYTGGVDPAVPWLKGNSYKLEFSKVDSDKYSSK